MNACVIIRFWSAALTSYLRKLIKFVEFGKQWNQLPNDSTDYIQPNSFAIVHCMYMQELSDSAT